MRRLFINGFTVPLVWLALQQFAVAAATTNQSVAHVLESLLSSVPPEVVYHPVDLAPGDNSFPLWEQAFAKYKSPESPELTKAIAATIRELDPLPTGANAKFLSAWIEDNRPGLELVEQGLQKPRCQFPRMPPGDPIIRYLTPLTGLAKARLIQAKIAMANQSHHVAEQLLSGNYRLSEMVMSGQGLMIHYLVGASIQRAALEGIRVLARQDEVNTNVLADLIAVLKEPANQSQQLSDTLRVEFTDFFLPLVDLDAYRALWRTTEEAANEFSGVYDEDLLRAMRLCMDDGLIAAHPKPLDSRAVAKSAGLFFQRIMQNSEKHWSVQESDDSTLEQVKQQWLNEMAPIVKVANRRKLPLTGSTLRKAAALYKNIENPVGNMILGQMCNGSYRQVIKRAFRNRANREATRTLLALKLYALTRGSLPPTLEMLVPSLLPHAPIDPFSDQPFRYSPDRSLIWSVGENGVDDDGKGSEATRWQGADFVWSVPGTKAP